MSISTGRRIDRDHLHEAGILYVHMKAVDHITTITGRGQITLPASVRRLLGVQTGQRVAFVVDGDIVRVEPVASRLNEVLGSVTRLTAAPTSLAEQLRQARRDRDDRYRDETGERGGEQ